MGPGGPFPLQLLDRGAELAAIATAIESACAGSGSALLVEGVAGIGKTRLLTHACEQAAQAGMTVLAARAAEFEDGYAWAACSHACVSSLVLPIPATPSTSSADPDPAHADSIAVAIAASSAPRSSNWRGNGPPGPMLVIVGPSSRRRHHGTLCK